ncbi:MAG: 5-(carboxyamino)imidazole ribonucleotide synthase [Erythrobacter sp.]|jgi:5-(carboxyamino)imidazole ribonucleotide synthase|nr:5-(carboxyamino)imidazole ribonucleotide synthase [Erythrobacter sp.]
MSAALRPGSTIGILGGGQLGRMLAVAALQLGYRVIGYAPPGDNVAAPACAAFIEAEWSDQSALSDFATRCDVVTWEFENVPLDVFAAMPAARVAPHPKALETAQDRLVEKAFVDRLGGSCAPYAAVRSAAELANAIERIGVPGIVKTVRDGYDGKGQWRIAAAHEAADLDLPNAPCVYEGLVRFETEFSVILVRAADGIIRFYESSANRHEGGMLVRAALPAGALVDAQMDEARAIAKAAAQALDYVGVLTLEFFATADGPVFNEMAPRVHNSGHWTIEGAATSQFENHIRAICGLPLGTAATRFASIEMRNIVGEDASRAHDILAEAGEPHLHLYGKAEARAGRKMGHVTRVAHAPDAFSEEASG